MKSLSKDDMSDTLIWRPVANEQGASLASGVYVFSVTQKGIKGKRGKLMVLK